MYHLYLLDSDQKRIKNRLTMEKNAKIWRRLQAIYSRNERIPTQEIARNLSVSLRTIGVWVKLYLTGGIEALVTLNYEDQGPKSKLANYRQEIDKLTDDEQIPTMTCLRERLKQLYDVEVEESWLSRWCKKNLIYLSKRPG